MTRKTEKSFQHFLVFWALLISLFVLFLYLLNLNTLNRGADHAECRTALRWRGQCGGKSLSSLILPVDFFAPQQDLTSPDILWGVALRLGKQKWCFFLNQTILWNRIPEQSSNISCGSVTYNSNNCLYKLEDFSQTRATFFAILKFPPVAWCRWIIPLWWITLWIIWH